jgi:hypothetical protein
MNKSDVTQELVNVFPTWSKVRTDEQSVGYQFLNAIGNPMERMEKAIQKIRDNQYITTANLDEIDLIYKIKLDPDFEWDEDTTDPLFVYPTPPEVSGLIGSNWYPVENAEFNDIDSFWYSSIPNRTTVNSVTSGEDHLLLSITAEDTTVTGSWEHHLNGGRIWVETAGGVQYLTFEENNVYRGRVLIKGKTRKGTLEEETLVFPWDMKQPTIKEWDTITEVHVFDIEPEVEINIRSADFNGGPYISPWNIKYSVNRNKIDEFWDLGHNGTIPTLDRIEYQSDEWQKLVLGFSTKEVIDSWELLSSDTDIVSGINITVSGVDMAIQPFTDHAWVATSDNKLYLYDLNDTMPENMDDIVESAPGSNIQIEFDFAHVVLGESIEFTPWHARPVKELLKYRIWYKQPSGEKFGLLNGSPVSFSTDFWTTVSTNTKISRTVEKSISIPTTQRGDYLIVFEAIFVDGEEQQYRRIFSSKYKTPLVVLDLSTIVPTSIDGIDFDSDQKLWVKSGNDYYQINLHTDIMLIDYANKTIYFKEEYEEIGINTNG